jgi:DNA-binding CsgD family transcriptional regulator/ribosomal protein S27E
MIHKKRWTKNPHGGSTSYTACGLKSTEIAEGDDSITKRTMTRRGVLLVVDCEKCLEVLNLGRVTTIVQCANCGVVVETPKFKRPKTYPEDRITDREAQIAACIVRGLTNTQTANELFVTDKTVKYHLTSVYRKLRVERRSELINLWFEKKLDLVSQQMISDYMPKETETGGETPFPVGI